MKKRMMVTLMAAATLLTAKAQTQPMVLSENHAMLRLKQETKYLLLPVQEKEENANIAVLDTRNEMVRRLNVRLAVDKVDYFVPFEIKNGQLLDIRQEARRRGPTRQWRPPPLPSATSASPPSNDQARFPSPR